MNRKLLVVMAAGLWILGLYFVPGVSAQPAERPEETFVGGGPQGGPDRPFASKEDLARRREEHFEKMAQELNLTAEQRDKIEAHRNQHMEMVVMVMENIRNQREAIAAEFQNPQFDLDKVKQLHAQLKELLLRKEDLMLSGILDIKDILTPEQFMLFHQKMGQMRKMHKERGKRRMPQPPIEEGEGE